MVILEYSRRVESSAVMYSLIKSAKANKLEQYKYLRYLFDHLPAAKIKAEVRALLPYEITREMIKIK